MWCINLMQCHISFCIWHQLINFAQRQIFSHSVVNAVYRRSEVTNYIPTIPLFRGKRLNYFMQKGTFKEQTTLKNISKTWMRVPNVIWGTFGHHMSMQMVGFDSLTHVLRWGGMVSEISIAESVGAKVDFGHLWSWLHLAGKKLLMSAEP